MKQFLLSLVLSTCISTSLVAGPDMQDVIDKYPLPELKETQSWQSKSINIDGVMHAAEDSDPYTGRYVSYSTLTADVSKGENIIFKTGSYTDGLKSGVWVAYDKRGKIWTIEHYQKGKKHGKRYEWWLIDGYGGPRKTKWWSIEDLDDTLHSSSNYNNGVKDGVETLWHINGEVHMIIEYDNGIKTGTWKMFMPDGFQYSETVYKDGKRIDGWRRNPKTEK